MLWLLGQTRPPSVRATELSYLPKGKYLKVAVLGYRQVAADIIWLKAVQHFGTRDQTVDGYRWAYHAVDVVTDLDPKFWFAYQAGGTVLGVWAGLAQESISLLTKGMRHNPQVWQLPFVVGYNYFYELCDPINGAKFFKIAAGLPGAPSYLPSLAVRLDVEGGNPEAAFEFLKKFRSQVRDQRLAEVLDLRMNQVMVERDIQLLEEGIHRYHVRFGRVPAILSDLVEAGILAEVPSDPAGAGYQYNNTKGTVISERFQDRLRVYRKQGCADVRNANTQRVGKR